MAITWLDKADATFDGILWNEGLWGSGAAGVSADASVKYSGLRSRKFHMTIGASNAWFAKGDVVADAGRRISFRLRLAGLPTGVGTIRINATSDVANWSAVGDLGFYLEINSSGQIRIVGGGTPAGNYSTATITTGTWYRIAVSYTITSSSVNEIRLYINGTEDTTARRTNQTTNTGKTIFLMGPILGNLDVGDVWIDSLYIDDVADLSSPGAALITAKLPKADNSVLWNTFVPSDPGAGSRYTLINVRPETNADRISETGTTARNCNFTLQTASEGDVDISSLTLIGYMGWVYASRGSGGSGSPQITLNGSDSAVTLAIVYDGYFAFVTTATYPSNAAGIGMVSSGAGADTNMGECGVMMAYLEPSAPAAEFLPRRGSFGQDARLRR